MKGRLSAVALTACILSAAGLIRAEDKAPLDAKVAFERLKGLAGDWQGGDGKEKGTVQYRVVSNGSVVMETMQPGTHHEMVSMYHLDGDDLRMTHYCAVGNQPRLKLNRAKSSPDDLVFEFDGGTNLDPAKSMHIHAARFHLKGENQYESEWTAFMNGKEVGKQKFAVTRGEKKAAPAH